MSAIAEACKAPCLLIDAFIVPFGNVQNHVFSLNALKAYALKLLDPKETIEQLKAEHRASRVVEIVTSCLLKSKGMEYAFHCALLPGS